jgi:hypothetical protein
MDSFMTLRRTGGNVALTGDVDMVNASALGARIRRDPHLSDR